MAYLIFNKNTSDLYKISANQTIMDANKGFQNEHVDVVEINESDFNNFKNGVTKISSRDGDTITWTTVSPSVRFNFQTKLQNTIDHKVNIINEWLKVCSTRPMASSVISYRDFIKGLDVTSIITEPSESATYDEASDTYSDGTALQSSLEKYVTDQGETSYHELELL